MLCIFPHKSKRFLVCVRNTQTKDPGSFYTFVLQAAVDIVQIQPLFTCHLGSLKNETYWPETERLVPWKQLALFRKNKHFMDENSFEAKARSQRPFMLVSLISRGCDVTFEGFNTYTDLEISRTSRLFDKCIICLFTPQ